jgi:hypothetical protein
MPTDKRILVSSEKEIESKRRENEGKFRGKFGRKLKAYQTWENLKYGIKMVSWFSRKETCPFDESKTLCHYIFD